MRCDGPELDLDVIERTVNGKYVDVTTGEQFTKHKLTALLRDQNRARMVIATSPVSPVNLCNHGVPGHDQVHGVTVDNETVAVHANSTARILYTVCDVGFGRVMTGPDATDMHRVAKEVTAQSVRALVDHGCWSMLTKAVTGNHTQKATYTMTIRMYGETKRDVTRQCPFSGARCLHNMACTKSSRFKCDQAVQVVANMQAVKPKAELTSTAPMPRRYNALATMQKLSRVDNRMDMTAVYTHMNTVRSVVNPELSRKHGKAIYVPVRRSGYVLTRDELFVDIDLPVEWDHTTRCMAKIKIIEKLLNDPLPVAWVLDTEHGLHIHLRLTSGVTEVEFHQLTKLLQMYATRVFSAYVDPACSDDVRLFKLPFCDSTDPCDLTHSHYICTPVVIGRPVDPAELRSMLTTADTSFAKTRGEQREDVVVAVDQRAGRQRVKVNGKKFTPITAEDAADRRQHNDPRAFTSLQQAVYNLDVKTVARLINVNLVDEASRTPVKRVEFNQVLLDRLDAVALLESSGERHAASDFTYTDAHWSMTVYADRQGKSSDAWRIINHAKCTVSTLRQYLMAFTGQSKQLVDNFLCALAGIRLTDATSTQTMSTTKTVTVNNVNQSLTLTPADVYFNDCVNLERGVLDWLVDDLAQTHGVTYFADPKVNNVAHAIIACVASAAKNHHLQPAWMRSLPLEQQQVMCVIDYIREGYLRMYNEPVTKDKVIEVLRFMLAARMLNREERGAFCHLNLERRVPGHMLMCVMGMRSLINADNHMEVINAAKKAQAHADIKPVYAWTWAYVGTWADIVATPTQLRTGMDMATAVRLNPNGRAALVDDDLRHMMVGVQNDASYHGIPVTHTALVKWCTSKGMDDECFAPGQTAKSFTSWRAILRYVQANGEQRKADAVECAEQVLLMRIALHWARIGQCTFMAMCRVRQHNLTWREVA